MQETLEQEEVVEYVDCEERPYISDDVVIDETNFEQYFFDVRRFKPKKGQILARYSSMAELVRGEEKKYLIKLLSEPNKALAVTQFMRKVLLSTEKDSVRIPMQMAQDLVSGLDEKKVLRKSYKFQMELFFYTWPECVPSGDAHWECVSLRNLDKFLEQTIKEVENENEKS